MSKINEGEELMRLLTEQDIVRQAETRRVQRIANARQTRLLLGALVACFVLWAFVVLAFALTAPQLPK